MEQTRRTTSDAALYVAEHRCYSDLATCFDLDEEMSPFAGAADQDYGAFAETREASSLVSTGV